MNTNNCKKCGGPVERGPRANNKKFCSSACRDVFSYETGKDRERWTRRNAKEAAKRGSAAPGKIQCAICFKWYRAPLYHVWQVHGMTGQEYRAAQGLERGRGLISEAARQHRRKIVKEETPEVLENLKSGAPFRYVPGDRKAGKYERRPQHLERLKNRFKNI